MYNAPTVLYLASLTELKTDQMTKIGKTYSGITLFRTYRFFEAGTYRVYCRVDV